MAARLSVPPRIPRSSRLAGLDDNVHLEDWQWLGRALAVEHRFAGPLIEGMVVDGLRVEVLR